MPPTILAMTDKSFSWSSLNPFRRGKAPKKKDVTMALRDLNNHLIMDGPDTTPYVATTISQGAQPALDLETQSTEGVTAFITKEPAAAVPKDSPYGFSSVQLPQVAEEEPKRGSEIKKWPQEEGKKWRDTMEAFDDIFDRELKRRSVVEKGHAGWGYGEKPQGEIEWGRRVVEEASVIRSGTVVHQAGGTDKQANDTSPRGYDLRLPDFVGGHCGRLGVWRDACPEEYFHALDEYGSGSGMIIAVISLAVASLLGLVLLGTVVVCGCKRRRKKKKAQNQMERTNVEAVWPGSRTTGKD